MGRRSKKITLNSEEKVKIAVLVSGNGSNLQALLDAEKRVLHSGKVCLVISNRGEAYALKRAMSKGVEALYLDPKDYDDYDQALLKVLKEREIDMIVLAGYLRILSADFIAHYPQRIINVHPSLLPSFGGKDYYGIKVHEAALRAGVKVSGATVHYVTADVDKGAIIAQKAVPVLAKDTAESLQQRILQKAEWVLLPRSAEKIAREILYKKLLQDEQR